MDVVGKYMSIWVTRDESELIFGFDPVSIARVYMLGGKIVAESVGLGLWIELDTVAIGNEDLFPDLAREKPRRFVRWDYIRAAEMFDRKPDLKEGVDFRPRLAA